MNKNQPQLKLSLLERLKNPFLEGKRESNYSTPYLQDIKQQVAQDLENLLNARLNYLENIDADIYPHAAKSVLMFGMEDFVGRTVRDPAEIRILKQDIEKTIQIHENRLSNVRVFISVPSTLKRSLNMKVSALLKLEIADEPVNFSASLDLEGMKYDFAG